MKIAVVGSGNWGKKIIKKLRYLNYSVKIIGRKDDFKKEISNFNTFFIITDDKTHFKFLNLLNNTNKKIYCEKPLTRKKSELNKIKKFKFKSIFVSDISAYYPNLKIKDKNFIYRSKMDEELSKNSKNRIDLLYRFLYHDLGYLIKKLKFKKINNLKIINSKKYLELTFIIEKKYFHFKYETNKKKKYTFNNQNVYTKTDNLKVMIKNFLNNKFNSKKSLEKSLRISKILDDIKIKINKKNNFFY